MKTLLVLLLAAALVDWLLSSRLIVVFVLTLAATVAPAVIAINIAEANKPK